MTGLRGRRHRGDARRRPRPDEQHRTRCVVDNEPGRRPEGSRTETPTVTVPDDHQKIRCVGRGNHFTFGSTAPTDQLGSRRAEPVAGGGQHVLRCPGKLAVDVVANRVMATEQSGKGTPGDFAEIIGNDMDQRERRVGR